MTSVSMCSPGSHPHSDQTNWQPAATIDAYIANCREGLEEYSARRAAKLLGWSRVKVWRAKLMSELPEELFKQLLANDVLSSKALAAAAQAFLNPPEAAETADIERCPHCGRVVRVRKHVSDATRQIIEAWRARP